MEAADARIQELQRENERLKEELASATMASMSAQPSGKGKGKGGGAGSAALARGGGSGASALGAAGTSRLIGGRHIFAIVCCVRSTARQPALNDTSLYPSFRDTITPRERKLWHVRLYLCADDNDELFRQNAPQVAADSPPGIETRLLFIPAKANRVPSREAAEQARADGAEYFHRTNDDIRYLSAGWLTASVRALRRLDPPNIGVAGPKVYGDGSNNRMHGGITIDVVHRTHLRIFREYYPPQLDNWYTDSWIVYAYVSVGDRSRRVVKMSRSDNFTVYHSFERRRYRPTCSQMRYLGALTECSRLAIWAHVNATRYGLKPPRPVSCTAYDKLPEAAARGEAAACSARQQMVGGIEMSQKDFQASAQKVEGYCRESGQRPAVS
jgi:hypothetical protein